MFGLMLLRIPAWCSKMISFIYVTLIGRVYRLSKHCFLKGDNLRVGLDLEMFSFIIQRDKQKHNSVVISCLAP